MLTIVFFVLVLGIVYGAVQVIVFTAKMNRLHGQNMEQLVFYREELDLFTHTQKEKQEIASKSLEALEALSQCLKELELKIMDLQKICFTLLSRKKPE